MRVPRVLRDRLTTDMRDLGETCGNHHVARLLRQESMRSQTGYHRRPGKHGGAPAVAAPNHPDRQFTPDRPYQPWVTDITYIRTHEGWLYLAVVIDLFSRQVIGWSMGSRIDTQLVLNALLMAPMATSNSPNRGHPKLTPSKTAEQ